MKKRRVLFVCVHNSARSQMAEAFLTNLGGDSFEAESAGIEPGTLNPVVVAVMREIGIDISGNKTRDVFGLLRQGKSYDDVITVCDESSGQRCPFFPGSSRRIHWSFEDPSSFTGTPDQVLKRTRGVRDAVKSRILEFLKSGQGTAQ